VGTGLEFTLDVHGFPLPRPESIGK
jgi:hypothetical protein